LAARQIFCSFASSVLIIYNCLMIQIGGKQLSLRDFEEILLHKKQISIDPQALEKVQSSFEFLKQFSDHKLIYGINTGFGPMAQYKISSENTLQLQYNLIRSHSSGGGAVLNPLLGRAVMITRLNNFLQGYSGVVPDLPILLADMINADLIPCIYEHGGVGASGDLVQLAHLALGVIGEGEVWYQGQLMPAAQGFELAGLKPLQIHIREGLALINGTSGMTGVGLLNIIRAHRLVEWAIALSALTNELMEVYDDHFSYELNIVKHHKGQN